MRAYRPTRAEQETVIRWDRDDPEVWVSSCEPATWRKMARLGIEERKHSTWSNGTVACRWYRVPRRAFRWGLKRAGAGKGNPAALQKAHLAVKHAAPDGVLSHSNGAPKG